MTKEIIDKHRRALEHWDTEKWREPDKIDDGHERMIWYGPGDEDGDCATEIEMNDDIFVVSEYQCVVGLIDDVQPGGEFLKTSTSFNRSDLETILECKNIDIPKNNEEWLRLVVGFGVAHLSYWGGSEEFLEELPR